MDFSETLNLPQTEFPMKADLNLREPELQLKWQEQDLYQLIRKSRRGHNKYILHDGPPYANGDVHIGTAFNKISKDMVVKYKTMRGLDAPYIPGWDCHGMPIEHKVVEKLPEADRKDRNKIRSECRTYAEHFVEHQRKQFKQLGVFADWNRPYLTMAPDYQAEIVRMFGKLVAGGFIYRGLKPVYWCTHCQSALAEAEIEYENHRSPSISVRFELADGWPAGLGNKPNGRVFVPIWTTTPWTIPANRAVAVHPELTYALVENQGDYYFLAKELVAANAESWGRPLQPVAECLGRELLGLKLHHPFLGIQVPVILGKHVTLEAGTGCVHTAPGHGQDDYIVGLEYQLEVYNPVGPNGCFTSQFPEMQGEFIFKANPKIIELLKSREALLQVSELNHSYPHCWRHHSPVIFRATEQWFMKVDKDNFRQDVLGLIKNEVQWIPAVSQNRISAMVENRPDWCLSRQRNWGVPVPVFYCEQCQEPVLRPEVFSAVAALFEKQTADAWFTEAGKKLLPEGTVCAQCGHQGFRQETDILDVWFDSGVSHAAVLEKRKELKFPADLYLEGSDQHRGWFQVSLLTAAATTQRAPFRNVLTHGYTVDGEGKKMSKSLGNFITAEQAIQRHGGADLLRLWVCSENIQSDVRFSDEIMKRITDSYRRIRNSLRFLLGNLRGFNPKQALKKKDQEEIDQLMLHRLHKLLESATQTCDQFDFYRFYQLLQNFCSTDLSAFYFDIVKDRLYADGSDSASRYSAQTTLWHILRHLVRLIAPVLVHTAEETWQHMKNQNLIPEKELSESVHMAQWLTVPNDWQDEKLAADWAVLIEVREQVLKKLEEIRNQKVIRHSYEAGVSLAVRGEWLRVLGAKRKHLAALFVVSAVEIQEAGAAGSEFNLTVGPAPGKKCERCWRILPEVGQQIDHPTLCKRCHTVVTPVASPPAINPLKKKA